MSSPDTPSNGVTKPTVLRAKKAKKSAEPQAAESPRKRPAGAKKAKKSAEPQAAESPRKRPAGAEDDEEDPFLAVLHPSRIQDLVQALPAKKKKKKTVVVIENTASACLQEGPPVLKAKQCVICGSTEHSTKGCPQKQELTVRKCTQCGQTGHTAAKCTASTEKRCFICGKTGHSGRKCPDKKCKICGASDHLVFTCPKKDQQCLLCGSYYHVTRACPEDDVVKSHGRCLICNLTGHSAKYCPEKKEAPLLKTRPPQRVVTACRLCQSLCHKTKDCTAEGRGLYCVQCGSTQHDKVDCPEQVCFLCNKVGHHQKACPEQHKERIFSIANAPPSATVASLTQVLSAYGKVVNVEYLGGQFKRFGWFVEFANSDTVKNVLATKVVIDGYPLTFQKGRIETSERIVAVTPSPRVVAEGDSPAGQAVIDACAGDESCEVSTQKKGRKRQLAGPDEGMEGPGHSEVKKKKKLKKAEA